MLTCWNSVLAALLSGSSEAASLAFGDLQRSANSCINSRLSSHSFSTLASPSNTEKWRGSSLAGVATVGYGFSETGGNCPVVYHSGISTWIAKDCEWQCLPLESLSLIPSWLDMQLPQLLSFLPQERLTGCTQRTSLIFSQ